MSNTAIAVCALGKQFRKSSHDRWRGMHALVERRARAAIRLALSGRRAANPEVEADAAGKFWALRAVDVEIAHGEVVALVGHNGAGKSVLLKILSSVMYPTTGFARIEGRVGPMLEVRGGFHRELTTRENLHFSGALLGMGSAEVRRKFDEIVTFAGLERFLDTPVKHLSSGMSLRLAFSVAAHLDANVLLVDELLSVGDMGFRERCVAKIREAAAEGRTLVVVSHDESVLTSLCRRAVLLEAGRILLDGDIRCVLALHAQRQRGDGVS